MPATVLNDRGAAGCGPQRVGVSGETTVKTRWAAAGAVAVAAVTLSGCQNGEPRETLPTAVPGTPASGSPGADVDTQAATSSALAAYEGFRRSYVAASARADASGKEIRKYVADPLLSELLLDLTTKQDYGLITKGKPTWSPDVTELDTSRSPFVAKIEDCFDDSAWQTVYRASGKNAAVPTKVHRYLVDAVVTQYDQDRWLVTQAKANREATC